MNSGEYYGWVLMAASLGVLVVTLFGLAMVWLGQRPRPRR
jgi:ABC-type transporter Mla subunit MlaD